jgi:hypothetical protein
MRQSGLVIVTVLTVLLTGVVLSRAAGRSENPSSWRPRAGWSGETILRFRQCQPTHWRDCLLQH